VLIKLLIVLTLPGFLEFLGVSQAFLNEDCLQLILIFLTLYFSRSGGLVQLLIAYQLSFLESLFELFSSLVFNLLYQLLDSILAFSSLRGLGVSSCSYALPFQCLLEEFGFFLALLEDISSSCILLLLA
jgi:hypothetical protein